MMSRWANIRRRSGPKDYIKTTRVNVDHGACQSTLQQTGGGSALQSIVLFARKMARRRSSVIVLSRNSSEEILEEGNDQFICRPYHLLYDLYHNASFDGQLLNLNACHLHGYLLLVVTTYTYYLTVGFCQEAASRQHIIASIIRFKGQITRIFPADVSLQLS